MGLYLLRRVDAGLLSLTRAAEIAMYAGAAHSKIRERVHAKLRESRRGSDAIESVLRGKYFSLSFMTEYSSLKNIDIIAAN